MSWISQKTLYWQSFAVDFWICFGVGINVKNKQTNCVSDTELKCDWHSSNLSIMKKQLTNKQLLNFLKDGPELNLENVNLCCLRLKQRHPPTKPPNDSNKKRCVVGNSSKFWYISDGSCERLSHHETHNTKGIGCSTIKHSKTRFECFVY